MSGRLILIASYPKSGNTWTRAILERLRRGPNWAFSINDMSTGFYGVSRRLLFDNISPVNAADMFVDEIDNLLPDVFRQLAEEAPETFLVKVHDDARRAKSGEWLYPPDIVHSVIYLVRHPFDVAVSCAHHLGMNLQQTVDLMADGDIISHLEQRLPLSLPQHVGSWSGNIASWLGQTPYRVTLGRYEDLHADPVSEFRRLAGAAGFAPSPADLARAVEDTRFERLRDEEKKQGFRERPPTSTAFFRAGKPRTWEGTLDQDLRDRLLRDHAAMMERLGYLPDGGIVPLPRHATTA